MKLRSFLILFATVLIAVFMAIIVGQSRSALNRAFDQLQSQHRDNIAQLIASALETNQQQLDSYGRILRTDNDLAGSYLLAIENGDRGLIQEKLLKIKENVKFDVVDIIAPRQRPILHNGINVEPQIIEEIIGSQIERTLIQPKDDQLLMLSLWTINLYDKPVGVLVLGTYLDKVVNTQVVNVTNSRIKLRIATSEPRQSENERQLIRFSSHFPNISATIEPLANPGSLIVSGMSYRLAWIGIISILILAVLFYAFLEIGFIRHFKAIVSVLDRYTSSLARGKLDSLALTRGKISEINLLADSFEKLAESLHKYRDEVVRVANTEAELKRQKTLSALARQVAHDIRSPLSALGILLARTDTLPEDHRILARAAITRITDIANNLLSQNFSSADTPAQSGVSKHLVSSLIESVLSEKRVRFKSLLNVEINYQPAPESFGVFAVVDSVEFKRVISNLVNNAVEALVAESGTVTINLGVTDDNLFIDIIDNGGGIPEHLIPQLGQLGFSFGKNKGESGSGLGLYHAKSAVKSWGGSLSIESTFGEGTKVSIVLPRVESPEWFAKHLRIKEETKIIVVDDDPSIHKIWDSRFADKGLSNQVIHFSQPQEFRSWLKKAGSGTRDCLLLIDFEFIGTNVNGLDLIESDDIEGSPILVTSHYDEQEILNRVTKLGVQMIPKDAAGLIPILNG